MFLTPELLAPLNPPTPRAILSYPKMMISVCNGFTIRSILEELGGLRPLTRLPWEILGRDDLVNPENTQRDANYSKHISNINEIITVFNLNQSDFFTIPGTALLPNSIYYFNVQYSNFLSKLKIIEIYRHILEYGRIGNCGRHRDTIRAG
jgi:hypothetical protein